MTVNVNKTRHLFPMPKDEIIEEIRLNPSPLPVRKSTQNGGKKYFKFNKKSSTSTNSTSSKNSTSTNSRYNYIRLLNH